MWLGAEEGGGETNDAFVCFVSVISFVFGVRGTRLYVVRSQSAMVTESFSAEDAENFPSWASYALMTLTPFP